jgi:hypothetical protein
MTLDEMVSAIRSNVGTGLKEVGNYVYSLEQIKDEISNMRSLIIMQDSEKGVLNREYFAQKITNLDPLTPGIFPEEGLVESNSPALITHIPKLAMTKNNSSILYLGPKDMSLNIKTYFSYDDLRMHKYNRTIRNRPFAFIDNVHNDDGDIPVYIGNTGPATFRYITVRAIVDDPVKLMQRDGYYIDAEEFPAPLAVQALIIEQLSMRYINYYKAQLRPNEFNDQTDKT